MADSDMRAWALKGAEQRLLEIAAEARAIYAAFPDLRDGMNIEKTSPRRRGRGRKGESATQGQLPRKRRRRRMSADARRRISEAQKARWAKQKAEGASAAKASRTSAKKR